MKQKTSNLILSIIVVILMIGAGFFIYFYTNSSETGVRVDDTKEELADTKEKSITLIFPNNEEEWFVGEEYSIEWDAVGVEKLDISYTRESSGSEGFVIAEDVNADKGSYMWEVPDDIFPGEEYQKEGIKIRISEDGYVPGMEGDFSYDLSDEIITVMRKEGGSSELETYTNEDRGFEVKFDPSWEVYGEFPLGVRFDPMGDTKEEAPSGTEIDDVNIGVSSYSSYGGGEGKEFDNWLQEEIERGMFEGKREIYFNKEYKEIEVINLIPDNSKKSLFLISSDNEKVATLILPSYYEDEESYIKLIESFKFLE